MGVNDSQVWHRAHPYHVITTMAPGAHSYACYGIKNTVTGVVEAYIGQLAKAISLADEYAQDLKIGIKSEKQSVIEMLDLLGKIPPVEGGGHGGSPLN